MTIPQHQQVVLHTFIYYVVTGFWKVCKQIGELKNLIKKKIANYLLTIVFKFHFYGYKWFKKSAAQQPLTAVKYLVSRVTKCSSVKLYW